MSCVHVLCAMSCVLCLVCYVLCAMSCVQCLVCMSCLSCRGVGRDITVFGVSVVIIRVIMNALAEEMPPPAVAAGPVPPLPGMMGR